MGLTSNAGGLIIKKQSADDRVIALAGNPNVGKSTLFNLLTGLKQHTGNWPGKTVANAQGRYERNGQGYILVDLPGTYSLTAHSAEEEIARDFICFGEADATIVVCDATCTERNLNLVLQVMEITSNVVVAVNLLDEARRKHIDVNLSKLEESLGVPVVGITARDGIGVDELFKRLDEVILSTPAALPPRYIKPIETAVEKISAVLDKIDFKTLGARFVALKLLENDGALITSIDDYLNCALSSADELIPALNREWRALDECGITSMNFCEKVTSCVVLHAEGICCDAVNAPCCKESERDRKIDKYLIGRRTGIPIMLLLLALVLWLTITGANYPSALLSDMFLRLQGRLTALFAALGAPDWLHGMLILGIYRVLTWVIAVMLPPMAIFFPLFTLLEDFGYLPRVAFNMDHQFQKAAACGKQSLTMCMGFGCNAAGAVGCRIIDSPRERLIAILTNSFVPCNGRFPTLIAISTMFFSGMTREFFRPLTATFMVTIFVLFGIIMTFLISRLLSKTLLKGIPSSFALELPPYRRPQIGKVLARSLIDRTLFVLGRAAAVAAPAGLIIWAMANIMVNGQSLLLICSDFLNPFARLLGLDGVILIAFILGFPANEIVVPIIIMAYTASGSIIELDNLTAMKTLFVDNGWTWLTAFSTMLFCLFHWPCSTTCITIKKETQSLKWTAVSFLLPTAVGVSVCFLFNSAVKLFM